MTLKPRIFLGTAFLALFSLLSQAAPTWTIEQHFLGDEADDTLVYAMKAFNFSGASRELLVHDGNALALIDALPDTAGRELWRSPTHDSLKRFYVSQDNSIAFYETIPSLFKTHEVTAIELKSGHLLWKNSYRALPSTTYVRKMLHMSGDDLIVQEDNTTLSFLDLKTGKVRRTETIRPLEISDVTTSVDGALIVLYEADYARDLQELSAIKDNQPLWTRVETVYAYSFSAPVDLGAGRALLANYDTSNRFKEPPSVVFDTKTGHTLLRLKAIQWSSVDRDRLYVRYTRGAFEAFDLSTLTSLWSSNDIRGSVILKDNTIYSAHDDRLFAHDAKSGKFVASTQVSSRYCNGERSIYLREAPKDSPWVTGVLSYRTYGGDGAPNEGTPSYSCNTHLTFYLGR